MKITGSKEKYDCTTSKICRQDTKFSCGQVKIGDYVDYIQKYHYICDCQ